MRELSVSFTVLLYQTGIELVFKVQFFITQVFLLLIVAVSDNSGDRFRRSIFEASLALNNRPLVFHGRI